MSQCPECEAEVATAGDVSVNEIVTCGECQAELEVITVNPVRLALPPEIEEDWGE